MKSALELVKSFCVSFFGERDVEKAFALLSDRDCWIGAPDGVEIQGPERAREALRRESAWFPEACRVEVLEERAFSLGEGPGSAVLKAKICGTGWERVVCISASAAEQEGESRLVTVHMILSAEAKKGEPPLLQLRQELFSDAVAGGMMGGYNEEG
ncbi:MAG: hypothetical protein PHD67_01010, partial [Oscillospiraceae bacterium]|nr:hypothetical protein [Oscillospiraceae bacterium]